MEISIETSVRRAELSDTPALTELVNRAYAVEVFFVDGPRTTADEVAALIASGGFLVLDQMGGHTGGHAGGHAADHAGGLAAAVLYRGPQDREGLPALSANASLGAYFGMLSVQPELQRAGLGRRLVQLVETMAGDAGAPLISLRVIDLREELTRWYKSLGYREVGTTPYTHRSVKRPCHFIEMAKSLTPAGSPSRGS